MPGFSWWTTKSADDSVQQTEYAYYTEQLEAHAPGGPIPDAHYSEHLETQASGEHTGAQALGELAASARRDIPVAANPQSSVQPPTGMTVQQRLVAASVAANAFGLIIATSIAEAPSPD